MEGLLIREATPADAHDIATVHVRSWQGAYRGLLPQDVLDDLDIAARAALWQRTLNDPEHPDHTTTLVAEHERRIVGFSAFGKARDHDTPCTGEIWAIYAHPDVWSAGVGHTLLTESEAMLRNDAHDSAYLWVLDGNTRGTRFYERNGWHPDGGTKIDERPRFTLREHRRVKTLTVPR